MKYISVVVNHVMLKLVCGDQKVDLIIPELLSVYGHYLVDDSV